jgi:hypothetical protein
MQRVLLLSAATAAQGAYQTATLADLSNRLFVIEMTRAAFSYQSNGMLGLAIDSSQFSLSLRR